MCNPIPLLELKQGRLALLFRGNFQRTLTVTRVGYEVRRHYNLRQVAPGKVKGPYEVREDVDLSTAIVYPIDEEIAPAESSGRHVKLFADAA